MEHLTSAQINLLIKNYGFKAAYSLKVENLTATWHALCGMGIPKKRLCLAPEAEYPFASALLLLVAQYRPFIKGSLLPAYYFASNAAYHKANALLNELTAKGYFAKRIEVPLAALVEQAGLGTLCKNSMLDIAGFGTRTVLFTLATNACMPDDNLPQKPQGCGNCTICSSACPAQAINADFGLDPSRCIRTYMESAPMPNWVMERLNGFLGCEVCQAACPRNAFIEPVKPADDALLAFELRRLLRGELKAASAYAGKNMCTRARLIAQAAALCALTKRHDLLDEVLALTNHALCSIREAAIWAKGILQSAFKS